MMSMVKKSAKHLAKSNLCIYRTLGWWTYEFCFGSHASQYHLMNNGSIEGAIINLGNYSTDFDWLKANESSFPISSGILYHEQYYTDGSICELTQKPRRVVAKIFCDEHSTTEIDLISEVETCIYEIHVNSHAMCNIPSFSKKQSKFNINCQPVVDETTYNEYLAKREKTRLEKLAKIKDLEKKVDEQVVKLNEEPFLKFEPKPEPDDQAIEIQDKNREVSIDSFIDSIPQDLTEKEKILEGLEINLDDLENFNDILLKENKKLFDNLKDNDKNEEEIKEIDDLLNKIEDNLDSVKSLRKQKVDRHFHQPGTIDTPNELTEKSRNDESENTLKSLRKSEISKMYDDLDKFNSEDQLTEENMNEIEKLTSGLDIPDLKGQKVKIKIIKIDSKGKNVDSDDLNSIFSSLLKENSEIKKYEKLDTNYNYIYDSSKDIEEDEEVSYASDSTIEKNTFITTEHINVEHWLNQNKNDEEETEQLIKY